PKAPAGLRHLLKNHYLHDAELISMGQNGQAFVLVLRLETPPRELLVLHYQLHRAAVIRKHADLDRGHEGKITWMYDEIGLGRGQAVATHDILFSNGWEVRLSLRDVKSVGSTLIYPQRLAEDVVPRSA